MSDALPSAMLVRLDHYLESIVFKVQRIRGLGCFLQGGRLFRREQGRKRRASL